VPRRLDIEVTSLRDDGTFTWRAAGAREPRGAGETGGLPEGVGVGDVLRAEIEAHLDGMTIVSVSIERPKERRATLLQLEAPVREFKPITEQRAVRKKPERPKGRPRPEGKPTASRGTRFTPPPEVPRRPVPKRLKPARVHREAVLETLPPEQRAVAEEVLAGGVPGLRTAIDRQNKTNAAEGRPTIDSEQLVSLAIALLPKLRVAEWRDRAEAARRQSDVLDLRDLRAVISSAERAGATSRPEVATLLEELRSELRRREADDIAPWLAEIEANLAAGRLVRALHLSWESPKPGQPFPTDLKQRLAKAASTALRAEEPAPRWVVLLEAVAFSPVRLLVEVSSLPATPPAELLATVKRLGPLLPQVASRFGIEVLPGAARPRPLRPERRDRKRPAKRTDARTAPKAAPNESTT